MKIYTKTGDDGSTGLLGGERVRKCDNRIDCAGHIDELNAAIGWTAVVADAPLGPMLRAVQSELFVLGAHVAVAEGAAPRSLPPLEDADIARLEMEIDAAENALPPLKNFILPGGSELAARLHIARTICRRAERRLVQFSLDRPLPGAIVTYLNRLSDWLFVQARAANARAKIDDIVWRSR